MKRVALGVLVLVMTLGSAPSAIATSITGNAAIVGINSYTLTGISFTTPGFVFSANGSLSATFGHFITLNDFSFASAKDTLLFDFTSGGTEFTMTILSLAPGLKSSSKLSFPGIAFSGIAMLTETGFSPTAYDFTLLSNIAGTNVYGLAITQPLAAPEPASLLLLGSGLLGLAGLLFRRAKRANSAIRQG